MVKSMISFKNVLARIWKNNLDFFSRLFFKITFEDYFAKILKNDLEKKIKIIFQDSCQNIFEQNH